MVEAIVIVASRAVNDTRAIEAAVGIILANFKKTRQDTWLFDREVYQTPLLLLTRLIMLIEIRPGRIGGAGGCRAGIVLHLTIGNRIYSPFL
jgi:hypothetical protein